MANINIPSKFKELLDKDQQLNGVVSTTLSQFGEILEDNTLYFFEEYTDHGIKHIESVLRSSEMLVTEDTFKNVLKSTDVGYYTLSVILHDIGMHLGLDGFKALLRGDFDDVIVEGLDTKTWKELWEEYYGEARRFSGKQLNNIFGKEDEIIDMPPFDDEGEIKSKHKKLVGEFIRRHHPRLAHEIALKGFPGKDEPLVFAKDLDVKYRNLIGLIARSHGMNLRRCADYLENEYGKDRRRLVYDCHAIFMMILLRIGDYIQVNNRTHKVLLKLKTFSSPFSEYEHIKDLDIEEVHFKYQDDPERIYIVAEPRDSIVYLKLNELVKGIQYELDFSWAVLGELYGTIQERPEIKYRRIKSNLEDKKFIAKQDYIADSFAFRANDEITKLLIAPLYGDDPTFGVRELLQNAIDACREREKEEKAKGVVGEYMPLIKVEVYKEGEAFFFKITDNGVGMDLNVIKNYFLSAGASYRNSMEWQKKFVNDKGDSEVQRSGRFGVGILAAFLIGKKIAVNTRKKGCSGYAFSTSLNSEQINIIKTDMEYETVIKISLSKDTYIRFGNDLFDNDIYRRERLSHNVVWNRWCLLQSPKIEYSYDSKKRDREVERLLPDTSKPLPFDCNGINSNIYQHIFWTYNNEYGYSKLTCNGIVIPYSRIEFNSSTFRIPNIHVVDKNALFPLSLDRMSITSTPNFFADIIEDVAKDYIAYLLTFESCTKVNVDNVELGEYGLSYRGRKEEHYSVYFKEYWSDVFNEKRHVESKYMDCLLCSKLGFILSYSYFYKKLGKIKLTKIVLNSRSTDGLINLDLDDSFLVCTTEYIRTIQDYSDTLKRINEGKHANNVYITSNMHNLMFAKNKKRVNVGVKRGMSKVENLGNWVCINMGRYEPYKKVITEKFLNSNFVNFAAEGYYNYGSGGYTDAVLDRCLEKYLGDDVVIPYDIEERKKKYPLAFKELERYMKKYLE